MASPIVGFSMRPPVSMAKDIFSLIVPIGLVRSVEDVPLRRRKNDNDGGDNEIECPKKFLGVQKFYIFFKNLEVQKLSLIFLFYFLDVQFVY